ncbi:hypothetical protein [Streptacidiphilus albus]|uniref:hypothetical protein n=1 Tax=Streptacidiphilus albus TaxID=105425 RepID=UPI0038B67317
MDRIHAQLARQGERVSPKRVRRLARLDWPASTPAPTGPLPSRTPRTDGAWWISSSATSSRKRKTKYGTGTSHIFIPQRAGPIWPR